MQDFLDGLVYQIKSQNGCAKDNMISVRRFGSVSISEPVYDALGMVAKKGTDILVLGEDGSYIGFISPLLICSLLANNSITKTTKLSKFTGEILKPSVLWVYETEPMSDVIKKKEKAQCEYVLVKNKKEKLTGILKIGEEKPKK